MQVVAAYEPWAMLPADADLAAWWNSQPSSTLYWEQIMLSELPDQLPDDLSQCDAFPYACLWSGLAAVLCIRRRPNQIEVCGLFLPRPIESIIATMSRTARDLPFSRFLFKTRSPGYTNIYMHSWTILHSNDARQRVRASMLLDWSAVKQPCFIRPEDLEATLDVYIGMYYELLALSRASGFNPNATGKLAMIKARYFDRLDMSTEYHRQLDLTCRYLMAVHTALSEPQLAADLLHIESQIMRARAEIYFPNELMTLRICSDNQDLALIRAVDKVPNSRQEQLVPVFENLDKVDMRTLHVAMGGELHRSLGEMFRPCFSWLPLLVQMEDVRRLIGRLVKDSMQYDDDDDPSIEWPKTLEGVRRAWLNHQNNICLAAKNGKMLAEAYALSVCVARSDFTLRTRPDEEQQQQQLLMDCIPLRFFCFVRINNVPLNSIVSMIRVTARKCQMTFPALVAPTWLFCADDIVGDSALQSGGFGIKRMAWNGNDYELLMIPDIVMLDLTSMLGWLHYLGKQQSTENFQVVLDPDLYRVGVGALSYLAADPLLLHPTASQLAFMVQAQKRNIDWLRKYRSGANPIDPQHSSETRQMLLCDWAQRTFLNARADRARLDDIMPKREVTTRAGWGLPEHFLRVPVSQLVHSLDADCCLWTRSQKPCDVCSSYAWDNSKYISYIQAGEWFFGLYVMYVRYVRANWKTPPVSMELPWQTFARCLGRTTSRIPINKIGSTEWQLKGVQILKTPSGAIVPVGALRTLLARHLRELVEELAVFGLFNARSSNAGELNFSTSGKNMSFHIRNEQHPSKPHVTAGCWQSFKGGVESHGGLMDLFEFAYRQESRVLHDLGVKIQPNEQSGGGYGARLAYAYVLRKFGLAALEVEISKKRPDGTRKTPMPPVKHRRFQQMMTSEDLLLEDKSADFAERIRADVMKAIATKQAEKTGTIETARQLWTKRCTPVLSSLAEHYLTLRHITEKRVITSTMRFCSSAPFHGGSLPALAVPVFAPGSDILVGLHCIYIAEATHNKVPTSDPKHTLGTPVAFARVNDPQTYACSKQEIEDARTLPGRPMAAIGEGPETMLAVACAFPAMRCYAGLSIVNMYKFVQLEPGESLLFCADNDPSEQLQTKSRQAAALLAKRGYKVHYAIPSDDKKDFCDLLKFPDGIERIRTSLRSAQPVQ